jgi:CPA1 family monovalent cation:H+ antiporter
MSIFAALGLLIALVACITYINEITVKAPITIAVTFSALLISLVCLLLGALNIFAIDDYARQLLSQIHFENLLLKGLLGPLLFAGSFTLDLSSLKKHAAEIVWLSTLTTIASALLVTLITYYGCQFLGLDLPLIWCFLFGALISPTDPVAVLATFKHYKMPASIKARIAGESLFNDGVGIVLFVSAFGLLSANNHFTVWSAVEIFMRESVCGLVYGWALGVLVGKLGAHTNQKQTLLLLTLATTTGGFVLANFFGFSGALAMVSCGMTVRYYLKESTLSRFSLPSLDLIWEVIEDLLNAVLFLLIGFEVLTLNVTPWWLLLMCVAVALVLLIRLLTVAPVLWWFHGRKRRAPVAFHKTVALFTWGGLRGGLAVALALSLPAGGEKSLILSLTYAIVVFAVIVQGFTIKPMVEHFKES